MQALAFFHAILSPCSIKYLNSPAVNEETTLLASFTASQSESPLGKISAVQTACELRLERSEEHLKSFLKIALKLRKYRLRTLFSFSSRYVL